MKKNYLLFYNLILALGWFVFLISAIALHLRLSGWVFTLLIFVQFAAVLEILHAALRWVPSPLMTTVIQVSSRIFILALLVFFPEIITTSVPGQTGVAFIIMAWSITEVVRYAHYAFQLMHKESPVLLWLRYTLFYFLYPLGVIGELLIVFSVLDLVLPSWVLKIVLFGVVFVIYLIFFPRMYRYMMRQRKKKLSKIPDKI